MNATSPVPAQPSPTAPTPERNRRMLLRRFVPWAGAALLAGLIVAGLWPQPPAVETVRVSTGAMRVTINEEGKTRIRQRFVVAAPVAGQLRRIGWKAGGQTVAGETVVAVIEPMRPALLDPRTRALAEARRDVALATVDRAKEAHRFASSELRRFEQLGVGRVVSPQELEAVQWREASAAREKAVAESSLKQAEAELREFEVVGGAGASGPVEVRAPVSGRVLRVFEESARAVTVGTPLLEIGDPSDLEAVIEVLSRDGAAIAPGSSAELVQWGGAGPLAARVRLVEPAAFTKVSALGVEEQRVNAVLDILTPAAERSTLGDQFRVEGRIVVWEEERTLKVPTGALFRKGQDWAAFVCQGDRLVERPVKVGRSNGPETQVLSGLAEGDEVVSYPGGRLRDGQRFKPARVRSGP